MDYSVNLRNQQQSVKKSWKSVFIPSTNDTTEKKKTFFYYRVANLMQILCGISRHSLAGKTKICLHRRKTQPLKADV